MWSRRTIITRLAQSLGVAFMAGPINFPEDTRLQDLERRLRTLENAPRLGYSSIGSGGLQVRDDGQIVLKDTAGNTLAVLSTAGLTFFESDGSVKLVLSAAGLQVNDAAGAKLVDVTTGGLKSYSGATTRTVVDQYGIQVNDAAGERARFGDVDHAGDYGGRMKDGAGNIIWSRTDAGTWRPTREVATLPDHANVRSTASAAYDVLWRGWAPQAWEDAFWFAVNAWCDTGVTYSLRFAVWQSASSAPDAADEITGLTNTAAAGYARTVQIVYGGSFPAKGVARHFTIEAKVTAGTGNAYVQAWGGFRLGLLADLPSEIG